MSERPPKDKPPKKGLRSVMSRLRLITRSGSGSNLSETSNDSGPAPGGIRPVDAALFQAVNKLTELLESHSRPAHWRTLGIDADGVYRKAGVNDVAGAIVRAVLAGDFESEAFDLLVTGADVGPYEVAAALKKLLRKHYEPLLTYALYDDFMRSREPEAMTASLRELKAHHKLEYSVLKRLMLHLARVAESPVNRMTAENIGICIGPNLLRASEDDPTDLRTAGEEAKRAKEIVMLMIMHVNSFFSRAIVTPVSAPYPPAPRLDLPRAEERPSEERSAGDQLHHGLPTPRSEAALRIQFPKKRAARNGLALPELDHVRAACEKFGHVDAIANKGAKKSVVIVAMAEAAAARAIVKAFKQGKVSIAGVMPKDIAAEGLSPLPTPAKPSPGAANPNHNHNPNHKSSLSPEPKPKPEPSPNPSPSLGGEEPVEPAPLGEHRSSLESFWGDGSGGQARNLEQDFEEEAYQGKPPLIGTRVATQAQAQTQPQTRPQPRPQTRNRSGEESSGAANPNPNPKPKPNPEPKPEPDESAGSLKPQALEELAALSKRLARVEEELSVSQTLTLSLTRQRDTLTQTLARVERERADLRRDLSAAHRDNAELQARTGEAEGAYHKVVRELNLTRSKADAFEKRLENKIHPDVRDGADQMTKEEMVDFFSDQLERNAVLLDEMRRKDAARKIIEGELQRLIQFHDEHLDGVESWRHFREGSVRELREAGVELPEPEPEPEPEHKPEAAGPETDVDSDPDAGPDPNPNPNPNPDPNRNANGAFARSLDSALELHSNASPMPSPNPNPNPGAKPKPLAAAPASRYPTALGAQGLFGADRDRNKPLSSREILEIAARSQELLAARLQEQQRITEDAMEGMRRTLRHAPAHGLAAPYTPHDRPKRNPNPNPYGPYTVPWKPKPRWS